MVPLGAIAIFLPLIREDLALTFTQAGLISAAGLATYAAMQIPAGYLADRYGPRMLFIVGLIITNLLSIQFAILQSLPGLLINQAASGIFRSFAFAPGLLLVSSYFSVSRRSTALSIFVVGAASGGVVVNSLGPLLVPLLGWRGFLAASALVSLVSIIVYWWVGGLPEARAATRPANLAGLIAVARTPLLLYASYIQFVRLALVQGLRYWLPTFLVIERGMSLAFAGLLIAVSTAASLPANLAGGFIADRLERPFLVIGGSLTMLAVTTALLVPVRGVVGVALVVLVQSLFLQAYFGPLFDIPIRSLGQENAGSISGFANLSANVGALTFSFLLGAVRDLTGSFDLGLILMATACGLGVLATDRMRRAVAS